ncbi:hypothetical protein [Aliarcobacter butzleri]|uniref:hypothetical protein n=1 Tax=Aliarcobacter butzleri TaxID=28197 RepID=UPI001EDA9270|nr:hypothetical protein [Aliarcobacter butzleri]MCG3687542.1 hypothetical protein [Aliarcobacter butzleri]
MNILNIEKDIDFTDNILNCVINEINGQEINISNVELKFQKNRTIIFTIYSNELIFRNEIKNIKGIYFNYTFFATILENGNNDLSMLSNQYVYIIDLIEFNKNDNFFINSETKFNLNIKPTKNFSDYIDNEIQRRNYKYEKKLKSFLEEKNINQINFPKDKDFINSKNIISLPIDSYIIDNYVVNIKILNKDEELANLFYFKEITYEEYNSKIKYIMELYSLLLDTPILIEKVIIDKSVLYQSQFLDTTLADIILNKNSFFRNNHFTINLYKYLDNFLSLKNSDNILDMLLQEYFLNEIYSGKKQYNLNDISGFIDLFDGIFFKLNGSLEKKEFICSECNKKKNTKQKLKSLNEKIEYILEQIEPELKQYEIDKNNTLTKTLSNFRNMVRHQKPYEKFDLEKLFDFSKNTLKLYIIKFILQIDNSDYNLYRILSDFNIYPLVKHVYKYLDKEILIYNTQIKENYMNKVFTNNTTYFLTLKQNDEFKNANVEDFIYDDTQSEELKKIYIDRQNKLTNSLLFDGVIIFNNQIIKSNEFHNFIGTYEDFENLIK